MPDQFKTLRLTVCILAIVLAFIVIVIFNLIPYYPGAEHGSTAAAINSLSQFLVDRQPDGSSNFLAWQNLMWIGFFWALAELFIRFQLLSSQRNELQMKLLPESAEVILTAVNMPEIHRTVVTRKATGTLGSMVKLLSSQFQISRSVSMCSTVLSAETESRNAEIDLGYNMVRYLVWMIPTLGFCGTVDGILKALRVASSLNPTDAELLPKVIASMSVAFWTTLLALVMSCIIMWVMHIIQAKEEGYLNNCSQYCLRNFINRLYEK